MNKNKVTEKICYLPPSFTKAKNDKPGAPCMSSNGPINREMGNINAFSHPTTPKVLIKNLRKNPESADQSGRISIWYRAQVGLNKVKKRFFYSSTFVLIVFVTLFIRILDLCTDDRHLRTIPNCPYEKFRNGDRRRICRCPKMPAILLPMLL